MKSWSSYLAVTEAKAHHVHRTVQITPGILLDIDAEGNVLGVEKLGPPLKVEDLIHVLKRLTFRIEMERGEGP